MATFRVQLSEDENRRMRKLAEELGLTVEELIHLGIRDWLAGNRQEFEEAVESVLDKNCELYKRLS